MTREAVSAFVKLMNKLDRVKKQLRPATTSAKRPRSLSENSNSSWKIKHK
jgi:hypothetical protein